VLHRRSGAGPVVCRRRFCLRLCLCYAEFASILPVAGGIYTYSYAILGELVAWMIGWDLILEYGLVTSAVSVGWSGYFQSLPGLRPADPCCADGCAGRCRA
jgi:amino acid transporter